MEVSHYCDLVEDSQGRWLAFGTLTGAVCAVDDHVRDALRSGELSRLSTAETVRLVRLGLLVPSRRQEQEEVQERLQGYRDVSEVLRYTLVTTFACNLRCTYCYEDAMKSRRGAMSLEVAEAVLDRVRDDLTRSGARQVGITLYGGEPLLNLKPALHVFEQLRREQEKQEFDLKGAIITNGTLFDESSITQLAPYIQYAQLTLDGGPEFHDTIRMMPGGRPTFQRICEATRQLVERGIRVMLRIQVCSQSIPSLEECFVRLHEAGILPHERVGAYFFPILDVRDVCSSRAFRCGNEYYEPSLFEHLWPYGERYGVMVVTPPVPVWVAPYCSFVNRWACLVDPQGKLYKCVADVGCAEAVTGSLLGKRSGQTKTQQKAEERFSAHRGMAFAKCRKCSYLPLCDGGCVHFAHQGGPDAEETPSCDLHLRPVRAWLERQRRLHITSNAEAKT